MDVKIPMDVETAPQRVLKVWEVSQRFGLTYTMSFCCR